MNDTGSTEASAAGVPGATSHHQPGVGLPVLLRRLYIAMREFCPTWEEWQAAVELCPVADHEPDPTEDRDPFRTSAAPAH